MNENGLDAGDERMQRRDEIWVCHEDMPSHQGMVWRATEMYYPSQVCTGLDFREGSLDGMGGYKQRFWLAVCTRVKKTHE